MKKKKTTTKICIAKQFDPSCHWHRPANFYTCPWNFVAGWGRNYNFNEGLPCVVIGGKVVVPGTESKKQKIIVDVIVISHCMHQLTTKKLFSLDVFSFFSF